MSIMQKLFGTTTPAAPATATASPAIPATPTQQGNIPAVPTVAVNPDGTPVVVALPEETNQSPLDSFKSLWETAPVDPNAPAATPAYIAPTAEQIQTAAAKADFTKNITPEQLASITAGGEEAATTLLSLMNSVGQQSLAQATLVSGQLNEKAMTAAIAAQVAKMPELVRSQTVQAHLKDTNPLFDNPAIKPVIEATQQQLQTKFPNATPAEITTMTQEYITSMGEAFAPKPVVETGTGADDWSNYLDKGQ